MGRPPIAGSRSYASGISLDSERPDRPRLLSLAQNGIGQATPGHSPGDGLHHGLHRHREGGAATPDRDCGQRPCHWW